MKKSLLTVYCLLLTACLAWAGVGGSSGVGFLKLGGGARPLAMGEAYVALADDASAPFYNPAGLSQINFPEVITLYNKWFIDTTQQLASVAFPSRLGVIGLSYSGFGSGDIQGYGSTGEATSLFNTNSYSLALSLSRKIDRDLSLGLTVKSVTEKLENSNASTVAGDFGLHYWVNPRFSLGLAALNLGSGLKFVSASTPLPVSYRFGAAFSGKMFGENIIFTSDYISYQEGAKLHLGVEYLIRNFLSLRAGSSGGSLRGGVGIAANLFSFDYAYLGHQDLGPAHQLSISLLFGAEEKAKTILLEELALGKAFLKEEKFSEAIIKFEKVLALNPKEEESPLLLRQARADLETQALRKVFTQKETEVKRSVGEILSSGKDFMRQGKHLEALAEFSKAIKLDPTHSEALKLQSEAQFKMERQLIEKSKEEGRKFLGEAMKLVVVGEYARALEQITQALEKDPKNNEIIKLKKKLELILQLEKK
jgi:tetratricopeptide (TPR) repeat protein